MESQLFESLVRKLRSFEAAHFGTLEPLTYPFYDGDDECNECLLGKVPTFFLKMLQVVPTVNFSDRSSGGYINVIMPAPEWDESDPYWVLRVEKGSECVHKVFYRARTQKKPGVIAQGERATARLRWVVENLEFVHLAGEVYEQAMESPVPQVRFLRAEVRRMLEDEAVR